MTPIICAPLIISFKCEIGLATRVQRFVITDQKLLKLKLAGGGEAEKRKLKQGEFIRLF